MRKNVMILAANGQIARLVESRVLAEKEFADVTLTLFLRDTSRLQSLQANPRVTLVEGDITDETAVSAAMAGQDLVFVAVVDHDQQNWLTKNVVAAMQTNHVSRVLFTNVLGIYNEVGGEFGRWNFEMIGAGMAPARRSDTLLAGSGLDYTTLRLPGHRLHGNDQGATLQWGFGFSGQRGRRGFKHNCRSHALQS